LIVKQLQDFYQKANQHSGETFDILKSTLSTFASTRASQAAASLAYYAIFSLFPLLLVLIAGGSYFLDQEQAYESVSKLVQNALPVPTQMISKNLSQVMDARGAVGIIGLLALLWSASGFFTSLAYNINLAWPGATRRNFLSKRLVGLGMIATLIGLFSLSVALEWAIGPFLFADLKNASSPDLNLWRLVSNLGSWLTIFLLFLALYRWIPTANVRWSASIWGALTASITWKLATAGFSWYLRSGLGRYQLVYGSLGAIVALLFLIFIMSIIALFGAHLSAAIDHWKNRKE